MEKELPKGRGAIGISEVSHAMLNTDAIGWPYFPGAFLLESTIPNNLVGMLLCWLFVGFFFFFNIPVSLRGSKSSLPNSF